MQIAPIALFTYNRLLHTQRTINALRNNRLASQSELIVYSDGPADQDTEHEVKQVREYLRGIAGFASVRIVEHDRNYGLAKSITEGVTEICERYGRVIVLEDDLVTSSHFLDFMNLALQHYEHTKEVWHVSGWNYPIDARGLDDAFLYRTMNCWGWATWADRWNHFDKDPERLVHEWDEPKIYKFNLDGAHNFWNQVIRNHQGNISTWAIFWYATIFENGGLCLNPARSYVQNIGIDGTGINCGTSNRYTTGITDRPVTDFPEELVENSVALNLIREFYSTAQQSPIKLGFRRRIATRLRNALFGYPQVKK